MKTYRVGLLVDGYEQPGWMHELVEWLAHSQDFQIAALLVAGRAGAKRRRISAPGLFGALSRFESRLLEASRARSWLAATCASTCPVPILRSSR